MLKHFRKRIQFSERDVVVETCSHVHMEKDLGTKEMGSNIPAVVDSPEIENVETVECSKIVSKEGEPEPMTPPGGDLNTPVFSEDHGT